MPPTLEGLRAGTVTIDGGAAHLIETIARRGCDEAAALTARRRILTGLGAPPADPTRLGEWAGRLRVSVKTLQRDFLREFGMPYTQWRTRLRLRAARVLLDSHPVTKVAHQVGYASPSAFITATLRGAPQRG